MSVSTIDNIRNVIAGDYIYINNDKHKVLSVIDIYLHEHTLVFVSLQNKFGEKSYLLFKEYNVDEFEFELFFEKEDFPQGSSRETVIEAGFSDIFAPPIDANDTKPCELYFAMDLYNENLRYRQHIDTVYGEISIDEGEYQLGSLNLWECKEAEDINSKILCLEIGGIDENGEPLDEGPAMYMYEGDTIPTDIVSVQLTESKVE